MTPRRIYKLIHEGRYAVEIALDLIDEDEDGGWAPYVSPQDARKLDEARLALRAEDLAAAAKLGKVFELLPVVLPKQAAE
jgi:hypothetical protein